MNNTQDAEFYTRLMKTIEEANKKQTEEIKAEIESLKQTIKEEASKRNKLELKYEELKSKYEHLEKSLRKNNIIIFGLKKNKEESLVDFTVALLNKNLNISLTANDINDIYTIGKRENNKPIIVKFVSYLKKQEVLKNCYKLKDINKNKTTKIYIAEELSVEERKTNKILIQHLKAAKTQKLNAYIKGDKLYINNEVYTAQQLATNEEDPDKEEKEENEDEPEKQESTSAPATPNIRNRKSESEEKETEPEGHFKTIKITTRPTTTLRSSSRIQEKEGNIQKIERSNERRLVDQNIPKKRL